MNSKPIAVIGNSPSALLAIRLLRDAQKPVLWVTGHSTQFDPALPVVAASVAAEFQALYPNFHFQSGSWIREFKNKSFRMPSIERAELLASESHFWVEDEARFLDFSFDFLRSELGRELMPIATPVREVEYSHDRVVAVSFVDGTRFEIEGLIFADRPSALAQIESLYKRSSMTARGRFPVGLLQAVFDHSALGPSALSDECFVTALTREAGEPRDRHAFGYFLQGGRRSVWTVLLTSEESEDHHFAGKRIRRLKQALDRMFQGETWLTAGIDSFSSAIEREQIRFLDDGMFSAGNSEFTLDQIAPLGRSGLVFFSDGYGLSSTLRQFVVAYPVLESLLGTNSLRPEFVAATLGAPIVAHENVGL